MPTKYNIRVAIIYVLLAVRSAKEVSEFNNIYDVETEITLAQKKHKIRKNCLSPNIVHRIQEIINKNPEKSMLYIRHGQTR